MMRAIDRRPASAINALMLGAWAAAVGLAPGCSSDKGKSSRSAPTATKASAEVPVRGGELPQTPVDPAHPEIRTAGGRYAGSEQCKRCHAEVFELWKGSDHYLNMTIPSPQTVIGDFEKDNEIVFGVTRNRMFIEDGAYFMQYTDPTGVTEKLSVDYAVGVARHQVYLHREPDGRLQVLPTYWHVEEGRWLDSRDGPAGTEPGEGAVPLTHPDFWRNYGRTFNRACMSCHSSQPDSGFDPVKVSYTSRFDPANNCESCHGPGADHVAAWSDMNGDRAARESSLPNLARFGEEEAIFNCGQCHALKRIYRTGYATGEAFFDYFAPVLWQRKNFFVDGRSADLNYHFVDYMQSMCYRRASQKQDCASICHTPHDLAGLRGDTVTQSNEICTGCHVRHKTQLAAHTHHAVESEGSKCIECHMPPVELELHMKARDHTIGSPLPELTRRFGVPNACNTCHTDESSAWAEEKVNDLWGRLDTFKAYRARIVERAEQLDRAFRNQPVSTAILARWLSDSNASLVERAGAASFLYLGDNQAAALEALLKHAEDPEPMVRYEVMGALGRIRDPRAVEALVSGLRDLRLVVRANAYDALALLTPEIASDQRPFVAKARAESSARIDGAVADDPRVQSEASGAAFARRDYAAAEARLKKAVALADPVPRFRADLLNLLLALRKLDEAGAHADWLAKHAPDDKNSILARASYLLASRRPAEAKKLVEQGKAKGHSGPEFEQARAMADEIIEMMKTPSPGQ